MITNYGGREGDGTLKSYRGKVSAPERMSTIFLKNLGWKNGISSLGLMKKKLHEKREGIDASKKVFHVRVFASKARAKQMGRPQNQVGTKGKTGVIRASNEDREGLVG